jgi:hypothetical protein
MIFINDTAALKSWTAVRNPDRHSQMIYVGGHY